MILTQIIVLSVLFVVTHLGMSHGAFREGMVSKMGPWPFRGLYSLVSFITLGPAAVLWWQNRHLGPVLWDLPFWVGRGLALVLTFSAVELIVLSLATPSPASMVPAKVEARGILRITRHPINIGIGCWALAHMLTNTTLGDVSFFGALLVVGVAGPYHLDARMKRKRGEDFAKFCHQTSVLPFAAIIRRRNRLALDELPAPLVVVALAVFAGLVVFHGRFFGGQPF